MVRSPRTQRLLLALLAVCLVASAASFAATATGQFAWQQRDGLSFTATELSVVDGEEPTVEVAFSVRNPTGVPVTVRPASVGVFDGAATEADSLAEAQSARFAGDERSLRVPARGTAEATVVVDLAPGTVERARAAIAADRAVVSGTMTAELRDRRFSADV
ncbi:hypothetical protein [Halobaculum lipolyticum]|uniref:LEA14-like dessication related protein n=1 Tax=Halobaculum lipolyticum TaxID=3032001 RepID=A0ABD5W4Q7_9EURY|nr:hypothetical protein [Halobaculum sp. DT31]